MRFTYSFFLLAVATLISSQRLPSLSEIQPADIELAPMPASEPTAAAGQTLSPTTLETVTTAQSQATRTLRPQSIQTYPPGPYPPRIFNYNVPQSNVSLGFFRSNQLPADSDKEVKQLLRMAQEEAFVHADEMDTRIETPIIASVRVRGGLLRLSIKLNKWPNEDSRRYFTWGVVIQTLIGLSAMHEVYPLASLKAHVAVTPRTGWRAARSTWIADATVEFQPASLTS